MGLKVVQGDPILGFCWNYIGKRRSHFNSLVGCELEATGAILPLW